VSTTPRQHDQILSGRGRSVDGLLRPSLGQLGHRRSLRPEASAATYSMDDEFMCGDSLLVSTAPSGLHELRVRNRLRVIGSLREAGSLTQASIARSTGLSRTTVSTVVHDLIKEGVVAENTIRPHDRRGGRPGIGLRLVHDEGVESA